MATRTVHIDPTILPEHARQELVDFYRFLVGKYAPKAKKTKDRDIDSLFNGYSLDMSSFVFDREEIHER